MLNVQLQNGAYYEGRTDPVELVVLHTAECPCEPGYAEGVARYLARTQPPNRASCHYVVDPEATVSQVAEEDTAWTAPGANSNGINIEQAGRARDSDAGPATDWASPLALKMLKTQTVPLVADICRRWRIPAVLLEPADLLAGKRGITDHRRVNDAFHRSDHTDCGVSYPLAQVVQWVKELLDGSPSVPSKTEDDDDMKIVTSDSGAIYLVGANSKREIVSADTWVNTEWAIKQLLDSGIASEWIQSYTDRNGTKFNSVPQGALDRIPNG